MKDLISSTTRGLFRDLMTNCTVGAIKAAFHDEGFAPNPDCHYEDTSVRRVAAQELLESIDWTDHRHVARSCQVFERLLFNWDDYPHLRRFYDALRRDGCEVDYPGAGAITPPPTTGLLRPLKSMSSLTDPPPSRNSWTASNAQSSTTPRWPSAAPRNSSKAPPKSSYSNVA